MITMFLEILGLCLSIHKLPLRALPSPSIVESHHTHGSNIYVSMDRDPSFGEYPHKRRKKYDRTSPQNVAPPGENIDDREPPNSINPLDNDYYSLQIIIPRQLRSTFEFVDFGREDGENFQDIINGYSVDKHGPFLGRKLGDVLKTSLIA